MNHIIKIFALILMSVVFTQHVTALVDVDLTLNYSSKTAIANCTGGNNICNVTLGAVGETVTLDVTGKPKTDLGTIIKDQVINLDLPKTPDAFKVFTFQPSTGDLAKKKITLLLQNVMQKPGSRLFGNTVFKLSRQVEGDKPTQWIWVADFIMNKEEQPTTFPFIVKADGTFISFDTARVKGNQSHTFNPSKALPEGVRKEILYIGSKDLNR